MAGQNGEKLAAVAVPSPPPNGAVIFQDGDTGGVFINWAEEVPPRARERIMAALLSSMLRRQLEEEKKKGPGLILASGSLPISHGLQGG